MIRLALLWTLAFAMPALGQQPTGEKYFTDVVLLDQDGKPQRLYSDLIRGKIVVMNSFFSTCTDSCPIMAGNMAKLQTAVGDRLGKDVHLLSFSVDPGKDTPTQLKAYAERFHAKPGWMFLTGSKENVDFALKKLGFRTEQRENHLNLFIMGNDPTGLWKKVLGVGDSKQIVESLESILRDQK